MSDQPSKHQLRLAALLALVTIVATGGWLLWAGWTVNDQLLKPADHWGLHPETAYGVIYRKFPELEAWHDSIAARGQWRDTTIVNAQGLRMHAIYVPCDGATATAVICHGYQDSAPIMMRYTYLYNHELHMNTIMPEWQNHGYSEGDHIQMGWLDRLDALNFVHLAHEIWSGQPMVIHGISMGATTSICAAGEETPPYLCGVVADCAFTSLYDEFNAYFYKLVKMPWAEEGDTITPWLYANAASMACRLRWGWSYRDASALDMIKRIEVPVFIIHGDGDPLVPTWMALSLYDAKSHGRRELWTPVSQRHARTIHEHWEEYIVRVGGFVRSVLPADPPYPATP